MSFHRLRSPGLLALCVLGGAAFGGAPAWAATGHRLAGSFGPGGPGAGEFSQVQSVAIAQSSEDVYVYDKGQEGRVYKFNSAGVPQSFSGSGTNVITDVGTTNGRDETAIAVSSAGPAGGDIYVARGGTDAGSIGVYSAATGGLLGELSNTGVPGAGGEPCGVAVDPAGHLYVSLANGHINKYTPTANPVIPGDYTSSLFGVNSSGENCNITVDGEENVYVDTFETGPVVRYDASQFNTEGETAVGSLVDASGSTVAVDLLTNELYIDQRSEVAHFSSAVTGNKALGIFGASGPGALGGESFGIAVNGTTGKSASGDVYVTDAEGKTVEIFEPGPLPPAPNTLPASAVAGTTAMLHGELNPKGSEVDFYFSYNAGNSCVGAGSITTPLNNGGGPATGSSPVEESALIAGLEPSTQYTFCLFASNAFGASEGSAEAVTTTEASPSVDGESASAATSTGAMLEAQVNPNKQETHYSFEYSTEATGETLEGSVIKVEGASSLAAEFGDRTASVSTGAVLEAGKTYFYRVVTENGTPPATDGAVRSFTTVPAPLTETATEVTGTTAVLNGTLSQVDSEGEPGYHFEYNIGGSCGGEGAKTTAPGTIAKASNEPVKTEVTGLAPRTQYTFCVAATNAFGSVTGSEVSLTTGAGKPAVEEESYLEQLSGVQLTALINPSGASATCKVEYGLETSYGSEAPCAKGLGEGLVGESASASVTTGLRPNQTYHYRFFATNEVGGGEGLDETFKSPLIVPVVTEAATASGIGRASALLAGTVNPENTTVFYHFIYGTTTSYGSSSPVSEGGSMLGVEAVSQQLEGLTPGTTYHYALVVSNPAGSQTSPDATFTTTAPSPPVALTGAASAITTTSTTVSGNVQPDSLPTTYSFQIGPDTGYGGELSGIAGSGSEPVAVSATFTNLQPGTLYHYRVLASNQDGISYGADQTTTTTPAPNSLLQPLAPPMIAIPQIQFPITEPTPTNSTTKKLTNAQKLAKALKACKKKPKSRRAGCVRQAHRKYPTTTKVHKG